MSRISVTSFLTLILLCVPLWAQPSSTPASSVSHPKVTVSPKSNPPTTDVLVSGSGFSPYAAIDIYFDTTDEALASANASGAFSKISIQVPPSAVPGEHWITAVQRSNDHSAQTPFTVNTNWAESGFTPERKRFNPYENVLSPTTVGGIDEQWSFRTGNVVVSSPVVANGVVYFGSGDHHFYAVNATTGALLWYFDRPGGFSSAAVANDVVYFGSDDNNVYALKATNGTLLWSFPTGNAVVSSPAVANGVVYVGSIDGNVYALKARTGKKLWSFPTGSYVVSSPAVANGVVYIGSEDDNVYALNATTGTLLWSFPTCCPVFSSPAVANGVVYFGWDNYNLGLYALNATTGALLWSFPLTPLNVAGSPAVADGVVYFGATDFNVYALNATTGALLWSFPTGNVVESDPSVVNGVVYVSGSDFNVYAFSLAGGQRVHPPERPALSTLHPDLSLEVSQPLSTRPTDAYEH